MQTIAQLLQIASEPELNDRLAHALDNLADMPLQNSLGTKTNPLLSLQTAFGMENIGGFPQLLQYMQQIETKAIAVDAAPPHQRS